jgi:hypothetical protein
MIENNSIESVSLEIANYWTSNGFLTETNKSCGTLVAFDWIEEEGEYYLTEINTNIDLVYTKNFKFDVFIEFLKKNNFTFVLGLRNIEYLNNPSVTWTDKLKESLKFNEIEYDEYIVDRYPSPIPEFDVPDNIFILRYSYDEFSKIDKFASTPPLFKDFMENSWKRCYKDIYRMKDILSKYKTRIIVLCSDIEDLVLKEGFINILREGL